jgi:hypothetical protein
MALPGPQAYSHEDGYEWVGDEDRDDNRYDVDILKG